MPAGIMDSKKINATVREVVFREICNKASGFAIATASVDEIDQMNILRASLKAMADAVKKVKTYYAITLVDGLHCPDIQGTVKSVVRGDSLIAEISAASILAKVSRDEYMKVLDIQYPEYGFSKNKGYPTKYHLEVLSKIGPCEHHRMSFSPVKNAIKTRLNF